MDPLSKLLALLKPRSVQAGRFDLGAKQGVRFPNYEGVKCYAVLAGQCWLTLLGDEPVLLEEGDCFLLPAGRSFCLASDLGAVPRDAEELLKALHNGLPGWHHGEAACTLAGGRFLLEGHPVELLLGSLPALMHLHTTAEKAGMRWSMDRIREELRQDLLGSSLVVQQLAYILLVQAFRVHLAEASLDAVGWLYAMSDPQIRNAILSMQEKPAYPWSVQLLAQHAGMSRSVFAERFKKRVGDSPMEYLTRWRMLLAGDRLTGSEDAVLSIAIELGYDSESAFGKAFKRVMGCSPRQYSHRVR